LDEPLISGGHLAAMEGSIAGNANLLAQRKSVGENFSIRNSIRKTSHPA
jgi:hypothetical protein